MNKWWSLLHPNSEHQNLFCTLLQHYCCDYNSTGAKRSIPTSPTMDDLGTYDQQSAGPTSSMKKSPRRLAKWCLLLMIQLSIRLMFSWCHGLGKSRHKNVHDQLWALPLLLFHAFDTKSLNVTCRNMISLTLSFYINMCSSSCIS